jgi:hypothetical protein
MRECDEADTQKEAAGGAASEPVAPYTNDGAPARSPDLALAVGHCVVGHCAMTSV